MSDHEEKCVSIYEDLAKIPTPVDVVATKSDDDSPVVHWEAVWSQRDLERNVKFNFKTTGTVDKSNMNVVKSPFCTEPNNEKIVRLSNNGKQRAIVREVKIKEEKTQFLEIWEGSSRVSSTNLTGEEKHGPIHINASFCCLEWSHNDKKMLYVAERKKPKTRSYFKKSGSDDKDVKRGDEYVYNEELGEQLVGCSHPIVVTFDVETQAITPLENCLPDDFCAGEAIWCKNDESIIVLGWKVEPWKLGLVYCKNRPSALYHFNIKADESAALTDAEACAFSPRLTPDGCSIIYLESKCFGPHQQCCKMVKMDILSKEKKVLVDLVGQSQQLEDGKIFHGLFLNNIPRNTWYGDEIILSSSNRSHVAVLGVNFVTGKARMIKGTESNEVLCVLDDLIFLSHSSPNSPPSLLVGNLSDSPINWSVVDSPSKSSEVSDRFGWKILQHKPTLVHENFPDLDYESILLQPSGEGKLRGVIINPHGGPHSVYPCGFDYFSAGFCMLGYAVLRINYRGSLGFGQNSVYSLPGLVGTQDVSDVQQAACETVKMLNVQNSEVHVHGGSHGGFLTLQLIGQYPQFYATAAVRNPVTNIASMAKLTDIEDWCMCETGQAFHYQLEAKNIDHRKMIEMSPISHVSKVKTPLLMMLGSVDLRVPPSQGHEYFKALKAHGGKIRLLKYVENDHPIAKVDAEADCFVNMALWFYKK